MKTFLLVNGGLPFKVGDPEPPIPPERVESDKDGDQHPADP